MRRYNSTSDRWESAPMGVGLPNYPPLRAPRVREEWEIIGERLGWLFDLIGRLPLEE